MKIRGHNIIILDEMDRNGGHKAELLLSCQEKNEVFMIWRRNGMVLFLGIPATADNEPVEKPLKKSMQLNF